MNIAVALSTYCPNVEFLKTQIDSLLKQENIVDVYIRDDGSSSKDHYQTLAEYETFDNIHVIYGDNVGVFNSFMSLLKTIHSTGKYDLIGFSDQDDMALPNKVASAVNLMSKDNEGMPLLYFSQMAYTDGNLNKKGVPYINASKLGLKNAIVESSANGNLIFMNTKACDLVLRHIPSSFSMHDWWCYLCVSAFGKILFDDTITLLYRQHEGNVVGGTSSTFALFISRLKRVFGSKKAQYPIYVQAKEFFDLYKDDNMPEESSLVLESLIDSKKSLMGRIKYAMSTNSYSRMRFIDQLILRLVIILNLY